MPMSKRPSFITPIYHVFKKDLHIAYLYARDIPILLATAVLLTRLPDFFNDEIEFFILSRVLSDLTLCV